MFNLIHSLFSKIAVGVSTVLIGLGSAISPVHTAPQPVASTEVASTTTAIQNPSTTEQTAPVETTTKATYYAPKAVVTPVTQTPAATVTQQVQTATQTSTDGVLTGEALKAAQAASDARHAIENEKQAAAHQLEVIQGWKDKITAINQQIVNLNTKYVSDYKSISANPEGVFGGVIDQKLDDLRGKYESDYQTLRSQYQQTVLDSNYCGSTCPQIFPFVNP